MLDKRNPYTSQMDPIFVVGYMHSGTTLLQNILRQNHVVYVGRGETKFFEFLVQTRSRFPNLADDSQLDQFIQYIAKQIDNQCELDAVEIQTLVREAKRYPDYVEVFCITFDYLATRAEKQYWVEKTPTHVFCIDEIINAIPKARILEIRRDVRDVLASKKTRRQTVWTDRYPPEKRAFKHLEKAYEPFWDTLSWKSAIRAGIRAQEVYPTRVYSVSYEDLVINSDSTIRKICNFLELDFSQEMLAVSSRNAADPNPTSKAQGIKSDSVGRWLSVLIPGEVALSQALARQELQKPFEKFRDQ